MDSILGNALSDIGFAYRLYNALFLVTVVGNWHQLIQRRRSWMAYLGAFSLPNLFWLLVTVYRGHQSSLLNAVEMIHVLVVLPFVPVRFVQSFQSRSAEQGILAFSIISLILIPVIDSKKYSKTAIMTFAIILFHAIFLFLFLSGIHISLLVQFRLAVIVAMLFVICFLDGRQRSPYLRSADFFPHYVAALLKTIMLFPILIVLIGAMFVIVIPITDRIGIPSAFIDTPIYIGVLYGPFAAVYLLCKYDRSIYFKASDLPL